MRHVLLVGLFAFVLLAAAGCRTSFGDVGSFNQPTTLPFDTPANWSSGVR